MGEREAAVGAPVEVGDQSAVLDEDRKAKKVLSAAVANAQFTHPRNERSLAAVWYCVAAREEKENEDKHLKAYKINRNQKIQWQLKFQLKLVQIKNRNSIDI